MNLDAHFGMLPERAFVKVGGRMTYEGGKSDSSPAPAPDYRGAAQEQSAATKEIATQQTFANRPNQFTPWGSTTWQSSAATDPGTGQGVTQWNQYSNLSPQLQGALDSQVAMQRGRSDLANSTMPRVSNDLSQPFSYQNMPARTNGPGSYRLDTSSPMQTTQTTNEAAFSADRRRFEDAAFNRMEPIHQRQDSALDVKLANQGLTPGSDAYKYARQELEDQQARERFNAIEAGGTEQQRMQNMLLGQQQQAFNQDVGSQQAGNAATQAQFGQDQSWATFNNTNRAQAIAEEQQRRIQSLNEMNALVSGQQVQPAQMPQFMPGSTAAQAPNYLGAATALGNYNMAGWQQQAQNQQAANSGLWGGLGSLAGAGASLYGMGAFSDVRLKSNIERVGTHPRGVGIYEYDIFGRRERGVMAQELLEVAPHLVHVHPSGYLMVNYGGL